MRTQHTESTIGNILLAICGVCITAIAVNHTVYEKGMYHLTWVMVAVPYTLILLNRPKYRAGCSKAIKWTCYMLAPYVGLATILVVLVWFFSWILGVA